MLAELGWAGTVLVLGAYAFTARTGRVRPFHAANVVGAFLLGASSVAVGAWPQLVLNVAFGAIGAAGLLRGGQ